MLRFGISKRDITPEWSLAITGDTTPDVAIGGEPVAASISLLGGTTCKN